MKYAGALTVFCLSPAIRPLALRASEAWRGSVVLSNELIFPYTQRVIPHNDRPAFFRCLPVHGTCTSRVSFATSCYCPASLSSSIGCFGSEFLQCQLHEGVHWRGTRSSRWLPARCLQPQGFSDCGSCDLHILAGAGGMSWLSQLSEPHSTCLCLSRTLVPPHSSCHRQLQLHYATTSQEMRKRPSRSAWNRDASPQQAHCKTGIVHSNVKMAS